MEVNGSVQSGSQVSGEGQLDGISALHELRTQEDDQVCRKTLSWVLGGYIERKAQGKIWAVDRQLESSI